MSNLMKEDAIELKSKQASPALLDYGQWLAAMGKTPITGWRWRKRGVLKTVNIFGRVYLTQEEAERFVRRAKAGEFAQPHKTPRAKTATAQ